MGLSEHQAVGQALMRSALPFYLFWVELNLCRISIVFKINIWPSIKSAFFHFGQIIRRCELTNAISFIDSGPQTPIFCVKIQSDRVSETGCIYSFFTAIKIDFPDCCPVFFISAFCIYIGPGSNRD